MIKRIAHPRKVQRARQKPKIKRKSVIVVCTLLSLTIALGIAAQWKMLPGISKPLTLAPASTGSLAASNPSKEYIYAGGRLVATEETTPSATATPTPTVTPASGSAPTPTPPPGGYHSLSLNGTTAYAQVPNSSSIDIAGPITVEAWIKLNSINGNYQDILCRDNWGQAGTGGGYELSITGAGKVRFDLYQGPTTYTSVFSNMTVSTNVWHHVAGVFDGNQMRVYVDGVLDGSLLTTLGPASGSSFIRIGNTSFSGASYYFGGLIDEVRVSAGAIYSSAFTPSTHLSATSSITKGLWKFDGQVGSDSSGNANDSTLNASATYSTDVPVISKSSLSLNGTDAYMQVDYSTGSTGIDIAGPITVEAWIKLNSINGNYQDILCRDNWGQAGTGGGYELSITGAGKVRFDLYQGPTTYTSVFSSTSISPAIWHHVAGVFDGNQMRVYVDGVLDGSLNTTSGPASGSSFIRIGNTSFSGASYYFGGLIDEVRVSAGALYNSNFNPQTSLSAEAGTRGLWRFDYQMSNDASGNSNNGTLHGGAVYSSDVPVISQNSLSLNGTNQYAQVPNSSSIDIAGPITVEAWIKLNSINGNYQDILCRDNWGQAGTGGGYELSITGAGKVRFDLYQGPTTYTSVFSNMTVSTNVWHHVAGVFDGNQMRVYVDGVLDGSLNTTSGPASGSSFIRIGNTSFSGASYYFGGLIDEVRVSAGAIYSSAFTPSTHLSATSSVTKGLWKFDNESLSDSSGNGNNCSLDGGATYSVDVPGGNGVGHLWLLEPLMRMIRSVNA